MVFWVISEEIIIMVRNRVIRVLVYINIVFIFIFVVVFDCVGVEEVRGSLWMKKVMGIRSDGGWEKFFESEGWCYV